MQPLLRDFEPEGRLRRLSREQQIRGEDEVNGVIVIDKPKGYTSFDVCAVVRKVFHEKKCGHAGTLDPQATGVLPVFLGSAAKAVDILPADDKIYLAEMCLGIETDTEDIFGNVLREVPYTGTEEELTEAIRSFIGTYEQTPPMYSAKKINGKKLYELAREGKVIERKAVPVTIHDIQIVSVDLPHAVIRVRCSKGTYIRTLIADIGKRAGTVACMSALRREKHGVFDLSDAVTPDMLKDAAEAGNQANFLKETESVFSSYPGYRVSEDGLKYLLNGNTLFASNFIEASLDGLSDGTIVRICGPDGTFRALYRYSEENEAFTAYKMFL